MAGDNDNSRKRMLDVVIFPFGPIDHFMHADAPRNLDEQMWNLHNTQADTNTMLLDSLGWTHIFIIPRSDTIPIKSLYPT